VIFLYNKGQPIYLADLLVSVETVFLTLETAKYGAFRSIKPKA
jgi:hypothetical protein